ARVRGERGGGRGGAGPGPRGAPGRPAPGGGHRALDLLPAVPGTVDLLPRARLREPHAVGGLPRRLPGQGAGGGRGAMKDRGSTRCLVGLLLLAVAIVAIALLMAGCISTAELVRALGQDPASVCVSVTTIYGKGAACRVGSAVEVKAGDGAISVTSK